VFCCIPYNIDLWVIAIDYTLHRYNLRLEFLLLRNIIGWQQISPLVEMTKAQFMTVLSLTNRQGFQTLGYLKLTAAK
jgi:hypothetical protein